MGLSDEGRYRGVFFSVCELDKIVRFDKKVYVNNFDYIKINNLLDNLWYEFLGKNSNSAYWFAGGSFDHHSMSATDLVGMAFSSHLPETDHTSSVSEKESDQFLNYKNEYLSLEYLLSNKDHTCGKSAYRVFEIFKWCENYFYYANRYQDEISDKLTGLSKIIAQLKGCCYQIFKQEEIFFGAWMLSILIDKCTNFDMVGKWVRSRNLHHDLSIPFNTDKLFNDFKMWQKKSFVPTSEKKLLMWLKLVGNNFHYKIYHTELIGMVNAHNKDPLNKNDKINVKKIELVLAKIIKTKDLKNSHTKEPIYCALTGNEI